MSGQLSKLKIQAYKKPDEKIPADTYEVTFNPNSFNRKYLVSYDDSQGDGTSGSPQRFKYINPQEYSFELIIDGTNTAYPAEAIEKSNVHDEVEKFLRITGKMQGEIHRPHYLKLTWGTDKLAQQCVLKYADINYSIFNNDGTPLKATVYAVFSEYIEDEKRVKLEKKSSPDLTHIRTVKAGDSLLSLTKDIYGDHKYYLEVARANKLNSFRNIKPGQQLYFPPVNKQQ